MAKISGNSNNKKGNKMNIIQELENEQMAKLNKKIPEFKAGDTVKVMYKIVEDKGERLQAYEGVCIARSNNGVNSSFTVRKITCSERGAMA